MTDLDDLIARLLASRAAWQDGKGVPTDLEEEAAAALASLRDEVARLRVEVEVAQAAWDRDRMVREAAVSEVRKLRAALKHQ